MTKTLWIRTGFVAFFLSVLTSNVQSQTFNGRMDCKFIDISVHSMKEGKYRAFSGINGDPKVGDQFAIIYSYNNKGSNKQQIIFTISKLRTWGGAKNFPWKDLYFEIDEGVRFSKSDPVNFSGEDISIDRDSLNLTYFERLRLKRYWKYEWSGFVLSMHADITVIGALRCNHTNDKFDEILKDLSTRVKTSTFER